MIRLLKENEIPMVYGTSLIGFIECSVAELIEKIGKPQLYNIDEDNIDTHFEWSCAIEDEKGNIIPFTIYDYKDMKNTFPFYKMFEFHIGANKEDAAVVKRELAKLIFN